MIRPFTCVCMVLAGTSGLYLYQAKHRVQLLDREITNTIHATETARERIGVLRAEWTLQNDPERLAQLADRFLALKTVTPGQFTSMAELDKRLPPIRAPETAPPAMDEDTPIASVPEPEPAKVASIPEPRPEPPRAAPPRSEPSRSEQPRAEQPRREAAPRPPAAPPTKVATVAPRPPERRHEPAPPPRMAAAETHSVITRVMATVPRPVSPAAAYTPVAAPAPAVTSVLGISRTSIAPPVPFQPLTTTGGGG